MRISIHTFQDADGNDFGTWSTQDYDEAKSYAAGNRIRIIANEYE